MYVQLISKSTPCVRVWFLGKLNPVGSAEGTLDGTYMPAAPSSARQNKLSERMSPGRLSRPFGFSATLIGSFRDPSVTWRGKFRARPRSWPLSFSTFGALHVRDWSPWPGCQLLVPLLSEEGHTAEATGYVASDQLDAPWLHASSHRALLTRGFTSRNK